MTWQFQPPERLPTAFLLQRLVEMTNKGDFLPKQLRRLAKAASWD